MKSSNEQEALYPFNPPKKNFVDKSTGTVYIHGNIDDSILTDVIPMLDDLLISCNGLANEIKVLNFKITSHGGEVYILLALLDIIDELRNKGFKITTHVRGYADSCASLLAAYGDKGCRTCGKYATSIVHHFRTWNHVSTTKEIDREYANNKRLSKKIKSLYLSHSKIKEKDYDEMVSSDCYELDAKELLSKGLVDSII